MPTPHISANAGDFAKTVLMPGDPKRAKFIAENFLQNAKLVSEVRGILAYTGEYNGKTVSIMASGMGNPSMGIYSYELFKFYDVENIIRIGTCGVYKKEYNLGDIAVATKSVSRSNYANLFNGETYVLDASKNLVNQAKLVADKLKMTAHFGNIYCSDTFSGDKFQVDTIKNYDCFGVEMETTALFKNAADLNKNAIAILTVSDNITSGANMSSKDRELSLENMIKFALEMI